MKTTNPNKHDNRFRLQQWSVVSSVRVVPQHWSEGRPRLPQPCFHWARQRRTCPPLRPPLRLHHHWGSLYPPASPPRRWWTGRGSVPSAACDTSPSPRRWLRSTPPPQAPQTDSSITSTRRNAATGARESESFHKKYFAKKQLRFKSQTVKIQSWRVNVLHPHLKLCAVLLVSPSEAGRADDRERQ